MIENWWNEVDRAILECLRDGGPMSPAELARRAGMSEGEATAFLAALIREGRVRMQLVEVDGSRANGGGRKPTNPAEKYVRHRG